MTRTLEQVRTDGLVALRKKLGRAGMIRFLQQFNSGNGDYASERTHWVNQTDLTQIRAKSRLHKTRPTH